MKDLPGLFVGMVKVFYTARAAGTTAGRRPGSWCVVWRRGDRGCGSGGRGVVDRFCSGGIHRSGGVCIDGVEYCSGGCDSRVDVTIAVSRYAILFIILGHQTLGYVALRHGYVGGGRAQ